MKGQATESVYSFLSASTNDGAATTPPASPRNSFAFHPKRQAPVPPGDVRRHEPPTISSDSRRRAPSPPRQKLCQEHRHPKRPAPSPPLTVSSPSTPDSVDFTVPRNRSCVNAAPANRPLPPLPKSPPDSPPVMRRLPPPPPRSHSSSSPSSPSSSFSGIARRPAPQPPGAQDSLKVPSERAPPRPPRPASYNSHSCPVEGHRKCYPPPRPPSVPPMSTRHATLPATLPSRESVPSTASQSPTDPRSLLMSDIVNFNGKLRKVKMKSQTPSSATKGFPTMQDIMKEAVLKRREIFGGGSETETDGDEEQAEWSD